MANMRLVPDTVVRVADIDSDPIVDQTLLDNLKLNSRSKVLRFDGDTNNEQEIGLDIVPTKAISAVVIGRHNLTVDTVVRIRMYSDLDRTFLIHDSLDITITEDDAAGEYIKWGDFLWGTIAWGESSDEEEFAPDPNFVYWVPTPREEPLPLLPYAGWVGSPECGGVLTTPPSTSTEIGAVNAVQSMTITITGLTQETEIGRLIIGTYIEPTYNISYNHTMEWREPTKQYRTEGGTLRSDIGVPNRKVTFSLNTIDAPDRTTISDVMRSVGLRRDFYLSLFPQDTDENKKQDYSGIVKLTKIPSMSEYAPLYYKSKYEVEEV